MKKYIQVSIVAAIAVLGLTLNSCKKDKDTTPEPAANGTLMFHLHTNADTAEVDYGTVYTMTSGRKISVTKAQLYITDVKLVKLDGSTYNVPNFSLLKKQEVEVYTIGSVPSGNYKSVRFQVGLTAATNASVPGAADSTFNQPQMWFGATAQPLGYIFVNFQGTIDTTASATGTIPQMQPFSYAIGTNANLANVSMPDQNFTVSPGQVQYVHLVIDYSKLFNGITLNVNSNLMMNTAGANTSPLATQLANNIPLMFHYE
ncbi:MAG: MbnP family protein [Bacteroidia bacterium]